MGRTFQPINYNADILRITNVKSDGTMSWIIENKEWLFSGIAISIPVAFLGWILSGRSNRQIQKGGRNSINIQVGGDVKIQRDTHDK